MKNRELIARHVARYLQTLLSYLSCMPSNLTETDRLRGRTGKALRDFIAEFVLVAVEQQFTTAQWVAWVSTNHAALMDAQRDDGSSFIPVSILDEVPPVPTASAPVKAAKKVSLTKRNKRHKWLDDTFGEPSQEFERAAKR